MPFFRFRNVTGANASSDSNEVAEVDVIGQSGLFDAVWYAEKYLQDITSNQTPIEHYITLGSAQQKSPHPLFDVGWYSRQYPDLAASGFTPLAHYITIGQRDNASPHPLFDPEWYRMQDSSLRDKHEGLLLHFLSVGAIKGLSPHPTFDPQHYYAQRPEISENRINPLTHFVECGAEEGLCPNAFFDMVWYRNVHADIVASSWNPLVHFLLVGAVQGARPHPAIDLLDYRQTSEQIPRNPVAAYIHLVRNETPALFFARLSERRAADLADSTDDLKTETIPAVDVRSFQTAVASTDLVPPTKSIPVNERQLALVREAKFVTFDVWDTLIRRDCHPDEIKLQSSRFVLLAAHHDLRPAFRDQVSLYRARLQAENASAPTGDFEFRFANAIDRWLSIVLVAGISPVRLSKLRSRILEHELQAEIRSTRADTSVKPLLEAARARALYASDFYMPAQFLQELLDKNGVGGMFLRGYASCDTYETKRGGKLFARIIGDLSVSPSEIVHIGDNWHADVDVPASKGIEAFHYVVQSEEERKHWFGKALSDRMAGGRTVHSQRVLALLEQLANGADGTERDKLFALGIRLAPIFIGFMMSVAEDAIGVGVDKVFFFTREGIFFRRLYDAMAAACPFNIPFPPSELLGVSRRATFAASMKDFSKSELMRLWSMYSSQSLQGLTHSLNLDPDVTTRIGGRHGLRFDAVVQYPWNDPQFSAVLEDGEFCAHAESRIRDQRDGLRRYLDQQGFTSGPGRLRLIVDIGWRGTIQDNLANMWDGHIRGHYLGLFQFLNVQPSNVDKVGWLGNDNLGFKRLITDAAPVEAICNSVGGSVVGYDIKDDTVILKTQIVEGEEQAIETYFSRIQDGVLAAIPAVSEYMRLHGLMSSDLQPLAVNITRSLLDRPPPELCDAFWTLHHNETFGVGAVDVVSAGGDITPLLAASTGSELHYTMSNALAQVRWPQSVVSRGSVAAWWKTAPLAERTSLPVIFSETYCPAVIKSRGARLSVFVPPPIRGSGGHRTICNMVRALARVGFEPHVFLEHVGHGVEVVEEFLAETQAIIHTQWHRHIPCDLAFATVAHSAPFVADLPEAHYRSYLVQDFEALFNPMSDAYLLAEESYTWPMHHFTIGNWLTHVINTQYGASARPAGLGVDTSIYNVESSITRERAICFLYQPDKPRRAPDRGTEILHRVSKAVPDVKIYVYGSDMPLRNLDIPLENLGLVTDIRELNKLYNRCTAGLCISGTNPSRIPFEMMAAGCIPVDLFRYNNMMDHVRGTSLLSYQGAASVAAALSLLLLDQDEAARRRAACVAFGQTRTLAWEMDALTNNVMAMMSGETLGGHAQEMMYRDGPFFAPEDDHKSPRQFCEWQLRLASNGLPLSSRDTLPQSRGTNFAKFAVPSTVTNLMDI
jgi:FMN phosphatase YigB (HAD superfamily)